MEPKYLEEEETPTVEDGADLEPEMEGPGESADAGERAGDGAAGDGGQDHQDDDDDGDAPTPDRDPPGALAEAAPTEPPPPTRAGALFTAASAAVTIAVPAGVYAVGSGLVPSALDPAWVGAGSCLALAALVSWLLLLRASARMRARDADVAHALQRLASGSEAPIRGEDPLAPAFLEAASALAADMKARLSAREEEARKDSLRETIRVKSQCERLVERYAERLHREKKDALAALERLRAEQEAERRAWEAGGSTVEKLRKEAESRCASLERRAASLDENLATRSAECARLSGEVDRLLQEVDRLRQQNVRFFDKVAAQLRGSLQIAGKLAADLSNDLKEKAGGKGKGRSPERPPEECVEEIRSRIAKLERLVEQILDLSRIETSTLSLVYSEADVGVALQRSCGEVRELAVSKSIDLSFKHPKGMPGVLTDARLLNRIVRELVSNAVRYTPRGGRVTATANVSSDCPLDRAPRGLEDDWLRVDVTDTGEGVRPEDAERIFTAFERGTEPQFTMADARPGLGLTLARHYARILGGDILLRTEPSRGSVFSLVLPVKVCVTTHVS